MVKCLANFHINFNFNFFHIYIIILLIRQCFLISNLLAVVALTKYKQADKIADACVTNAAFYP